MSSSAEISCTPFKPVQSISGLFKKKKKKTDLNENMYILVLNFTADVHILN